MSAVASLLVRFHGKRMATPRDFNARITRRGPGTYELDLEMIIRGRKHGRKAQTAKSSCRAQVPGCTTEAQQRREIDQHEAGIVEKDVDLAVPLDDVYNDHGDIC